MMIDYQLTLQTKAKGANTGIRSGADFVDADRQKQITFILENSYLITSIKFELHVGVLLFLSLNNYLNHQKQRKDIKVSWKSFLWLDGICPMRTYEINVTGPLIFVDAWYHAMGDLVDEL